MYEDTTRKPENSTSIQSITFPPSPSKINQIRKTAELTPSADGLPRSPKITRGKKWRSASGNGRRRDTIPGGKTRSAPRRCRRARWSRPPSGFGHRPHRTWGDRRHTPATTSSTLPDLAPSPFFLLFSFLRLRRAFGTIPLYRGRTESRGGERIALGFRNPLEWTTVPSFFFILPFLFTSGTLSFNQIGILPWIPM